jgi:hypothetical protein
MVLCYGFLVLDFIHPLLNVSLKVVKISLCLEGYIFIRLQVKRRETFNLLDLLDRPPFFLEDEGISIFRKIVILFFYFLKTL